MTGGSQAGVPAKQSCIILTLTMERWVILVSYMSVIISISRSWTSFILPSSIWGIAILTVI